jgi:hypothetical protein
MVGKNEIYILDTTFDCFGSSKVVFFSDQLTQFESWYSVIEKLNFYTDVPMDPARSENAFYRAHSVTDY